MKYVTEEGSSRPCDDRNLENCFTSPAKKLMWHPCQKLPPWRFYYRAGRPGYTVNEYTM